MKQIYARCLLPLLFLSAVSLGAQEFNSVPLDHAAYYVIEMGVMRGIISPPPSAKPWSEYTVKEKLREMIDDPVQILNSQEINTIAHVLSFFERKTGLDHRKGRYRTETSGYTVETGIGWESSFSVTPGAQTPGASFSSVNLAKIYAGGDISDFVSWNITALGQFLYIGRDEEWLSPPSFFPYSTSKQWDRGVLSLSNTGEYTPWPDDPALAYGFLAELNGSFFDERLQLRLGRLRRDWGPRSTGASLYMNAQARPFAAFEGTFSPFSWLDISFLGGALEYYREGIQEPDDRPFANALSLAQLEFNPVPYIYFGIGGGAVLLEEPNAVFFADLELRLPGMLKLWGSLFLDRLDSSFDNFFAKNGNSYAYQAGVKTVIHWLPLAAFTFSYTKIEPYCYASSNNGPASSAYVSGGESLGYYLPPNSDELLFRFESRLLPELKAHIQFQMIRHGADYGYGAVPGSSIGDRLADTGSEKYFVMDGVYRWDNVIKIGGDFSVRARGVPVSLFAETGFVLTSFTINGNAGIGVEADYEALNDDVYRAASSFIFSVGFRLFL